MKRIAPLLALSIFVCYELQAQHQNYTVNGHGQGINVTNTADQAGTYITLVDHDGKKVDMASFDSNYPDINFQNSLQFFARGGKNIQFATSADAAAGNNKFVILNNGNVGIGLNNPQYKLDINGQTAADRLYLNNFLTATPVLGLKGKGAGQSYIIIEANGSSNRLMDFVENSTGNYIRMYKSGAISTLISSTGNTYFNSGGNVGIGTTTPDAKLTVKGDIHTREVRVDLNGATGPDFVFEEDYNLRSLEETEAYILAHKHLPEIPSAAEMEKNGIELKEMNLKLLQKVEELTLHLIRQEKEIAALKNKVAVLEER